jgi:hypothetical protein
MADPEFQSKSLEDLRTRGFIPSQGEQAAYYVLNMKMKQGADTPFFDKVLIFFHRITPIASALTIYLKKVSKKEQI